MLNPRHLKNRFDFVLKFGKIGKSDFVKKYGEQFKKNYCIKLIIEIMIISIYPKYSKN